MNEFFLNKTSEQINDFYLKELGERTKNNTTQIFSFDDIYTSDNDSYNDIQLSDIDNDIDDDIDELLIEFKKLNKDNKLVIINCGE